jgi:hypothetical protein
MENTENKPPLFDSWRSWYWLLLAVLALQIILFSWLTFSFA